MQIRNFYAYILNKPIVLDTQNLSNFPFKPCTASQESSIGWIPSIEGELVYKAHGGELLTFCQEKRLLPASVVNDYLQEKIEQFEAAEGYPPSRKVRQQMKDDLIIELLPKAFTKSTKTHVLHIPRLKMLFVLSGSAKLSDDITAFLRESLGSLPISLLNTDVSPSHQMTKWLSSPAELPDHWTLGEEVTLEDADSAKVKVCNQNLFSDELSVHMDSGKVVSSLALTWRDMVAILLQDDLAVKRVKLLMEDEAPQEALDTDDGKAAHEFAVSLNWLVPFMQDLVEALGGLDKAVLASMERSHAEAS